ncbi:MAG: TonB-dependent receptor, partial [Archangiaceae bacterium]|nr:TonB-dependent receptor [Archangiaceae bacterium]
ARVSAAGTLIRTNPGGGGAAVLGGGAGPFEALAAVSGFYFDRSGLQLPASSPALSRPGGAELQGRTSQRDIARPKSLFVKSSIEVLGGKLTFLGTAQNLDAVGEFQDFGPLSHGTRISVWSEHFRLLYDVNLGSRFSLQASAHYLQASPSSDERLNIGRNDYDLIRSVGVNGFGANVEGRYQFADRGSLTIGLDGSSEDHLLQAFDQHLLQPVTTPEGILLKEPGTITVGDGHGARKTFLNAGAFAQLLWGFAEAFTVVAGARVDVHNIYGANPSFRAGVVYAPLSSPMSIKLLYGSSFKAPSADQLYTQPMKLFDIHGNPALHAQTAHTFELSFARAFGSAFELSANAYALDAVGRVEYVQRGLFLEAQNLDDEWIVGGELEARLKPTRLTQARVSVSLSRSVSNRPDSALPPPRNPLYPWVQAHAMLDQGLVAGLHAVVELSYVGPRAASQSNALVRGENYELPGYLFAAVALSLPSAKLIGERTTRASVRVSNVLTTYRLDPGFGGIDLPSQGITAMLLVTQQL